MPDQEPRRTLDIRSRRAWWGQPGVRMEHREFLERGHQDGAVPGEPESGSPPRQSGCFGETWNAHGAHGHVQPDADGVQGLRVETVEDEHVLRVALHGECDFSRIHELDQALRNITLDGARLVHLDLTHLAFADVATIRRLAAFTGHAKRTGQTSRRAARTTPCARSRTCSTPRTTSD